MFFHGDVKDPVHRKCLVWAFPAVSSFSRRLTWWHAKGVSVMSSESLMAEDWCSFELHQGSDAIPWSAPPSFGQCAMLYPRVHRHLLARIIISLPLVDNPHNLSKKELHVFFMTLKPFFKYLTIFENQSNLAGCYYYIILWSDKIWIQNTAYKPTSCLLAYFLCTGSLNKVHLEKEKATAHHRAVGIG